MNLGELFRSDVVTVSPVEVSSRWSFNILMFGLLIDIMYRSAVRQEAPWDLFALIFVSVAIGIVPMARHRVLGHFGKPAILGFLLAFVVAFVAALLLAVNKAM